MGINSTHRTNTETKTHINEKSIRLVLVGRFQDHFDAIWKGLFPQFILIFIKMIKIVILFKFIFINND